MLRAEKIELCQRPTPLQPLLRLSQSVGGPSLYIKRDDCTGLAMGGNKARKLEFLMADARSRKADVIVATGALQSNHVRQTAAAAAHLGLECHVVLEERLPSADEIYRSSGNILLDRLFGASVHLVDAADTSREAARKLIDKLVDAGRSPYLVPDGGSDEVGAIGYVECASEVIRQATELGIDFDYIVHATNSGGTQAGLVAGLTHLGSGTRVIGVSVRRDRVAQETLVRDLVSRVTLKLNLRAGADGNVVVNEDYIGPAYGVADPTTWEAVRRMAEYEGILLDPVYTGKAMACLLGLIRNGQISARGKVLFLHTGGTPALFAYGTELNRLMAQPVPEVSGSTSYGDRS